MSLFKHRKEGQTLEQFYKYQDHSKYLKAMVKTIEDEIYNFKEVNYRLPSILIQFKYFFLTDQI